MKKLVPKAITFDVYGTILDSHGCWDRWYEKFMERKGYTGMTPKEAVARWEAIQFEYLKGPYVPHYELKRNTFRMACSEFGWDIDADDVENFSHGLDIVPAFPDSRKAIEELRKYTKVVTLTNVPNELVEKSFNAAGIEVDRILTSQDAQNYKPKKEVFLYSQKVLGLGVDELLHAAFGFLYDIVPATALGYRTVWINRLGIPRLADVKEKYLCGDLETLVILIKGMAKIDEENEAAEAAGEIR